MGTAGGEMILRYGTRLLGIATLIPAKLIR